MSSQRVGILLFAHGSRDERWRLPVEAVARRIDALAPGSLVSAAYLELAEPGLEAAADSLIAAGAAEIRVLPLFLGVGRHLREDLPRLMAALEARHPAVSFSLRPAIGEDAEVIDLLAKKALQF